MSGFVVVKIITRSLVFLLVLVLIVPLILAVSLSFSSPPVIISAVSNITTTDPFHCEFTPLGDGALTANVTWILNTSIPFSWESVAISNNTLASSAEVNTTDTSKGQMWYCSVRIENGTANYTENSTAITIANTLPVITSTSDQVAYEDSEFNLQMTYTDADRDSVIWDSADLNMSLYADTPLFEISPGGLISFLHTDESLVGNHTMKISADDLDPDHEARVNINFEFIAVNDLPIFTNASLTKACIESFTCSGTILATDEEGDPLNFTTNETFINLQSDGTYSFNPTYAQAVKHNYYIQINVSDGIGQSVGFLNLSINTTNHAPNVTYQNISGTQNDPEYYFLMNVTDAYDPQDFFNFTLNTTCGKMPWSFTQLSNGSNSTSAFLEINQSLNSNDFVECRDATITVHEYKVDPVEPKGTYVYSVFFNITNQNDAPIIHNMSYYSQNLQNNIHNLSGAIGLSFLYRVNATDVDILTYEGDSLTYSLIAVPTFSSTSIPLFSISPTTGTIVSNQSSMNDSYLGNHSFFVVVTDNGTPAYNYTKAVNISVAVNFPPQIFPTNSSDCAEESSCLKYFAANDTEGSLLELLLTNLSYTNPLNETRTNYTSDEIATLLGINLSDYSFAGLTTNFTMNMSSNDSVVGLYVLNYTYRDDVGKTNSSSFTFNITNIPEAPRLDNNYDHTVFENITFGIFAETVPFLKYIYGFDEDLFYNQDTLNYTYEFIGPILPNFTVSRINNTVALVNFTPPPYETGNFTVNITVTDSTNLSDSQIINFTVHDKSEFPNITHVRPYFDISTNETIFSFMPIQSSENITSIVVHENQQVTFNIIAKDTDNLSMLAYWYRNGVLNRTLNYTEDSAWTYHFSYFDSGLMNFSVQIWDIGYDLFKWNVTVLDENRPPQFLNPISNYTGANSITGRQTFYNFFLQNSNDIVFLDPDDDLNEDGILSGSEHNTLNFSVNTSGSCDEIADFEFNNQELTVSPSKTGTCSTNFIASDSYGEIVHSNTVVMNIIRIEGAASSSSSSSTSTRTVTQTVTIPLEIEVDVPEWFSLIEPGVVSIYENGSVVVPIELKNNLDKQIRGISLNSNTSAKNITLKFSKTYFDSLDAGASTYLNLTAYKYRANAPFEINVSAYIDSLDYTDYAVVYVNALEKGDEDTNSIKSKISFARDLLNDNPECSELFGLLLQAEKGETNDSTHSLKIVNGVISGCKYLINEGGPASDSLPRSFIGKIGLYTQEYVNFRVLGLLFGSLLVLALAFGLIMRFKLKRI